MEAGPAPPAYGTPSPSSEHAGGGQVFPVWPGDLREDRLHLVSPGKGQIQIPPLVSTGSVSLCIVLTKESFGPTHVN